ncbi:MAG: hypothetical protein AB7N71_08835 [Phycisphaerae bacterium]
MTVLMSGKFIMLVGICAFFGIFLVGTSVMVLSFKMIGRIFNYIFGAHTTQRPATPRIPRVRCPHPRCGELNQQAARFCKRCGNDIHQLTARSGDVDVRG